MIEMEKREINRIKRVEELPEVLTMPLVARVLGCSLNTAYGLLEVKGFPRTVVGHRVYVDRAKFLAWIDAMAESRE